MNGHWGYDICIINKLYIFSNTLKHFTDRPRYLWEAVYNYSYGYICKHNPDIYTINTISKLIESTNNCKKVRDIIFKFSEIKEIREELHEEKIHYLINKDTNKKLKLPVDNSNWNLNWNGIWKRREAVSSASKHVQLPT